VGESGENVRKNKDISGARDGSTYREVKENGGCYDGV